MRDLDKVIRELYSPKVAKEKRVPSDMRNLKCPCGSGRKSKNCHCEEFTIEVIKIR